MPDPGKAQDFVKKFNQVLGDDEKLRSQLELLISPTCSCKQADVCVVSKLYSYICYSNLLIEIYISLKPALRSLFYLYEFTNIVSSELSRSISLINLVLLSLFSQIPGKTLEN